MYYFTTISSPVGEMTLAADNGGEHLIGLWLKGQKYHGSTLLSGMTRRDDTPLFQAARAWLDRYFAGEKPPIAELPLAPIGSAFRQAVWDILCEIPYGEVITYGEIAQKVAKKMAAKQGKATMSAQAVGGAVGHNPISIIIPCHRVIGADGSLTGYAGGIQTKVKLLELEGADMSRMFVPTKGTAL